MIPIHMKLSRHAFSYISDIGQLKQFCFSIHIFDVNNNKIQKFVTYNFELKSKNNFEILEYFGNFHMAYIFGMFFNRLASKEYSF